MTVVYYNTWYRESWIPDFRCVALPLFTLSLQTLHGGGMVRRRCVTNGALWLSFVTCLVSSLSTQPHNDNARRGTLPSSPVASPDVSKRRGECHPSIDSDVMRGCYCSSTLYCSSSSHFYIFSLYIRFTRCRLCALLETQQQSTKTTSSTGRLDTLAIPLVSKRDTRFTCY